MSKTKTESTTESTTNSANIFMDMMNAMKGMNPMADFQPIATEIQAQMQQNVQDWLALQTEAQQTMQALMMENNTKIMAQMQNNIKQGVELSQTMFTAQQNLWQETAKMMQIKK